MDSFGSPHRSRYPLPGPSPPRELPGRSVDPTPQSPQARAKLDDAMARQPRLEIEYCTQCRWLLRAAWMAQELLTTFEAELG